MNPKKNKSNAWMDDGDSAHWIKEKTKKRKVSVTGSEKRPLQKKATKSVNYAKKSLASKW